MIFQNTQNQVYSHMEIVLHGNKIENVDYFKCLGIWIDNLIETLIGRKIQMKIAREIAQSLAIINKIKPLLQSWTLKQIYNALIQPHLSFVLFA